MLVRGGEPFLGLVPNFCKQKIENFVSLNFLQATLYYKNTIFFTQFWFFTCHWNLTNVPLLVRVVRHPWCRYLHFPCRNGQVQVFEYGRLTELLVRAPHDDRRRGTGHDRGLLHIFGRSFVTRHHRRGHVGHSVSYANKIQKSHCITGHEV